MNYRRKGWSRAMIMSSIVCFGLVGFTSTGMAGEGHDQKMTKESHGQQSDSSLPAGHRIIYGTVEGVFENTIKVNSGETGEITPRFLELEKLGNKADGIKPGDRVKITVNSSDNKVVDYELANKKH